jgi:DNA-binding transcriptional ArsR family regulator
LTDHDPAGRVFAALSDATRREVMRCLSREPDTATGIAARLPVSRQAVSKHLSALAEAGLVVSERFGREVRYKLRPEPLTSAMSWMATVGADWDERLGALRAHLERRAKTRSRD